MLPSTSLFSILLLATPLLALILPNQPLHSEQETAAEVRQARIAAFYAQKPMHTTALLAGAAAAPTPVTKVAYRDMRIHHLRPSTGEDEVWQLSIADSKRELGATEKPEDEEIEEEAEGRNFRGRIEEKIEEITKREGWERHNVEI